MSDNLEIATLAGGCFWCTAAIFKRLSGVKKVVSGYCGGGKVNPTEEDIYSGDTGHAESIQITFDPKRIAFEDLLEVFFHLHDPTTVNRQGADVGSHYRSVIFYHDKTQQETAERIKEDIENSGIYKDKIVTEIVPYKEFYKADDSHQNFYAENRNSPYCLLVIDPKIKKLMSEFSPLIKPQFTEDLEELS